MHGALHVLVVDDDPDTALLVRTGAMPLTVAAGAGMPSLALDLPLGRPLPAEVPFTELAVVRYLEDVFLAPSDVLPEETAR
ncbi:hypothetical protein [Blastococcus sp. SYSU DS0539]